MYKLYTIGFTEKTAERFFYLLSKSGATHLIDIRLNNASQLAGFTKKDDLPYFLKEILGWNYSHCLELAPTKDILDVYKKNGGDWSVYETKFINLIMKRQIEKTLSIEKINNGVLLCSEHKPQCCHRRLVAEYLNHAWGGIIDIVHLY